MGLDVASGNLSPSPDGLLPLDGSESPGVAPPTPIVPGQLSGPTYPGLDTTAMNLEQQRQGEADVAAAMAAGMAAEQDRRSFYQADIEPLGAEYGIEMTLPQVPEQRPGRPGGSCTRRRRRPRGISAGTCRDGEPVPAHPAGPARHA